MSASCFSDFIAAPNPLKRLILKGSGNTCLKAGVKEGSGLDHVIRQFVCVFPRLGKISRQHVTDLVDCFDHCVAEPLILKMVAHSFHNALPEFVATFFVNGIVANDREFMSTGHYENQHGAALVRLVHPEPMKLPLRRNKGIPLELPTLDQDANLTGGFGFRIANRFDDPVVLEFG